MGQPITSLIMLREQFLSNIRKALHRAGYFPDDFVVTQRQDKYDTVLDIRYQFQPKFRFVARITTKAPSLGEIAFPAPEALGTIKIIASPGDFLKEEEFGVEESKDIIREISGWVDRVAGEIKALPEQRQIEEQRQLLEQLTAQFEEASEGGFTKVEAEALRGRLDELEERLTGSIRSHIENQKEANAKIRRLHREIETLKSQVEVLSKKGWTKSMMIRIANWLKDPTNQQLLKSGGELAKSVLLPPSSPPSSE